MTVSHEVPRRRHLTGGYGAPARIAAAVAASIFSVAAGFQLALAVGAPWGQAAWGGSHEGVLPAGLRVASIAVAAFFIVAVLVVLGRAGYWPTDVGPFGVFRWGIWALAALMTLSAFGNVASSSAWERFLNAPVALLLALLCLVTAVGRTRHADRRYTDRPIQMAVQTFVRSHARTVLSAMRRGEKAR